MGWRRDRSASVCVSRLPETKGHANKLSRNDGRLKAANRRCLISGCLTDHSLFGVFDHGPVQILTNGLLEFFQLLVEEVVRTANRMMVDLYSALLAKFSNQGFD